MIVPHCGMTVVELLRVFHVRLGVSYSLKATIYVSALDSIGDGLRAVRHLVGYLASNKPQANYCVKSY